MSITPIAAEGDASWRMDVCALSAAIHSFVRVDTRTGEQLASARVRVEQEAQNEMVVCRANDRDGVSLDQGPFERADEAVAEGSRGAGTLALSV